MLKYPDTFVLTLAKVYSATLIIWTLFIQHHNYLDTLKLNQWFGNH